MGAGGAGVILPLIVTLGRRGCPMLLNILAPVVVRNWQGSADPQAGIEANPITDFLPMADGFYAVTRAGGFGVMRFAVGESGLSLAQRLALTGQPEAGQVPQLSLLGQGLLVTGAPQGAQLHGLTSDGVIGAALPVPSALQGQSIADFVSPVSGFSFGIESGGRNLLRWSAMAEAAPAAMLGVPQVFLPPVIGPRAADFALRDLTRLGDILIAAGGGQDALMTWRVMANGALGVVAMVKAADLGMSGAVAVEAMQIAGQSYVALLGHGASSLDILRLDADGRVSAVDHVNDSGETRFYRPSQMASISDGERAFIAVSGSDKGLSLFQLLPDGRLLHLHTEADGLTTHLDGIGALALSLQGDVLRVMAAGGTGSSLTMLEFALPQRGVTLQAHDSGQSLSGTGLADLLMGGAGADTLSGGAGTDILIDGAGRDRLTGGAGADVFILDADGARDVIADFSVGSDMIDMSRWTRLRGLSQLEYNATANGAILRYANEELEILSANGDPLTWAQLLRGGLVGLDRLLPDWRASESLGGVGYTPDNGVVLSDRYRYVPPPLPEPEPPPQDGPENPEPQYLVTDPRDTSGPLAGETYLAGNGVITGGAGPHLLLGGIGADRLTGGAGNDRLDGRGGADVMAGGRGDDLYFVDHAGDRLIEAAGEGHDVVYAWVSYVAGQAQVEDIVLLGSGPLSATGNGLSNRITGNGADNLLDGGGGRDELIGGRGDDFYIVRHSGDITSEVAGQGRDTIWSHVTWTLQAETERLFLKSAGALDGTGNALGNEIIGNAQANLLNGKGGVDYLRGGRGTDVFVFDQQAGAVHADRIKDFTRGEDRLALAAEIFGLPRGTMPARHFARLDEAHTPETRLVYDAGSGWLSFDPDGSGAAAALPFARLAGAPELRVDDIFIF